ncbi:MAG: hypothetical protein WDZ59_05475 [Pirellulales bacterium]
MHRTTVGITAAVLLSTAAVLAVWQPTGWDGHQPMLAACLRVGLVLGALWLAHPQLSRMPSWLFGVAVALAVVVALRPKLIVLVVPLAIILWLVKPRASRRGNAPRSAYTRRRAD